MYLTWNTNIVALSLSQVKKTNQFLKVDNELRSVCRCKRSTISTETKSVHFLFGYVYKYVRQYLNDNPVTTSSSACLDKGL